MVRQTVAVRTTHGCARLAKGFSARGGSSVGRRLTPPPSLLAPPGCAKRCKLVDLYIIFIIRIQFTHRKVRQRMHYFTRIYIRSITNDKPTRNMLQQRQP